MLVMMRIPSLSAISTKDVPELYAKELYTLWRSICLYKCSSSHEKFTQI